SGAVASAARQATLHGGVIMALATRTPTDVRNALLGTSSGTTSYGGMANAGNNYAYQTQQQPYSMANAGNIFQRRTAPTNTTPTYPATGPTAGTPSTAGSTAANPGGVYVGQQYVPQITATTTLSPAEQGILDRTQQFQTGLLDAGNKMTGTIPTGAPDI